MWALLVACGGSPPPPSLGPSGRAAQGAVPPTLVADQVATAVWTGWFGTSGIAAAGDLDGDGVPDWVGEGGPADTGASFEEEVQWRVSGAAPSGAVEDVGVRVDTAWVGHVVSAAGDEDGDGRGEVFLAGYSDEHAYEVQRAELAADGTWNVLGTIPLYAPRIPRAADVTGDGVVDFAYWNYLSYGPIVGPTDPHDVGGVSWAGGDDLDGDGIADLVTTSNEGLTRLETVGAPAVPTPAPGGVTEIDGMSAVQIVGDVDGDGHTDLAVARLLWASEETVVVAGPLGPTPARLADRQLAMTPNQWLGMQEYSAPIGDADGDGFDDVVFWYTDGWFGWEVLAHGPLSGTIDPETLPRWRGPLPYDRFGLAIAAQDMDNDGVAEIAVSAPSWGAGTAVPQGAVFVLEAF